MTFIDFLSIFFLYCISWKFWNLLRFAEIIHVYISLNPTLTYVLVCLYSWGCRGGGSEWHTVYKKKDWIEDPDSQKDKRTLLGGVTFQGIKRHTFTPPPQLPQSEVRLREPARRRGHTALPRRFLSCRMLSELITERQANRTKSHLTFC